jgi:thiamine biosynthesis lipoprotein
MRKRTAILILLAGLLLILALFLTVNREQRFQQHRYVFGTWVDMTIWGVSEKRAHQAINAISTDFQTQHHQWHAWHSSPLTDLNQAIATGQTWNVQQASLLPLLVQAKRFSDQSDGLFNPAIGQLIALWGFHQDDLDNHHAVPPAEKIAELVALAPSLDDIEIDGKQVTSRNRAVQFDFGAFAKGYAVDLAIDKLRSLGIHNAIVNAGGDLKAIGQKGEQPWLIGIRHPSGKGVLAACSVSGEESVMTSGDYERFRESEGVRYSHLLNPRTGWPVQGLTSVTVIDRSGVLADAASTALSVAGLPDWHRIARQMGIKYVMLVDDVGTVYMNPAMAARIQFPSEKQPKIVVSEPL